MTKETCTTNLTSLWRTSKYTYIKTKRLQKFYPKLKLIIETFRREPRSGSTYGYNSFQNILSVYRKVPNTKVGHPRVGPTISIIKSKYYNKCHVRWQREYYYVQLLPCAQHSRERQSKRTQTFSRIRAVSKTQSIVSQQQTVVRTLQPQFNPQLDRKQNLPNTPLPG